MLFAYWGGWITVEVGECSGNTTDAVIAATRKPFALELGAQHEPGSRMERRKHVEMCSRDLAVEGSTVLEGAATGGGDTSRDHLGALAASAEQQVVDTGTGNADAEIEPIEQRTAEATQIAQTRTVVALARARWAAAARARVGGRDQEESSRKGGACPGSGHTDHTLFEGLTEAVKHHR